MPTGQGLETENSGKFLSSMQPPTVVVGVMGQTTQISIMSLKQSKALKPGEASETHWGWWECGFPGLGLSDWSRVCPK